MGADNGEFGGQCYYVDLRTGQLHMVNSRIEGVLGFLRSPGGRVIVYGGMDHMGYMGGYIANVGTARLQFLKKFESNNWPVATPGKLPEAVAKVVAAKAAELAALAETMPRGPIDLMLEDHHGHGFWVVSAQTLYHADENFKDWRKETSLGGRWIGGRRSSMGSTPTVNRLFEDSSQPGSLIALRGLDGVERINGASIDVVSFTGQPEGSVVEIWNTSIGPAMMEWSGGDSAWVLQGDEWQRYRLFPDRPPTDKGVDWYEATPFGREGDDIFAFCHDARYSGEADVVRLDSHGIPAMVVSWQSSEYTFDSAFLRTSDGTTLKISDGVWIQHGDGWVQVGDGEVSFATDRMRALSGRRYVPIGKVNDADYFLDADYGELFQLTRSTGTNGEYRFGPAVFKAHPAPKGIFDAFVDGGGSLLLATTKGMSRFHLESGQSERIPNPNPAEVIKSLCRDEQGRLWAAGDGLYLSSDEGKHWEKVKLTMLGIDDTKRIRPNWQSHRGLMLTQMDRGTVFLDW